MTAAPDRRLRISSSLPESTEAVATKVIDACIQVHRELGPGLLESVYQRAAGIELRSRGIPFEREKLIPIVFRNEPLCHHRLDLVVDRTVVVELKAVDRLSPVHLAQVISYLRASRLRCGLLINFNVPVLKQGLRRVVL
jgi:GxxExxY protein